MFSYGIVLGNQTLASFELAGLEGYNTFTVLCILLAMLLIWFFENAFALSAKIVFTLLIKCNTRITKPKEKHTNCQTPKS